MEDAQKILNKINQIYGSGHNARIDLDLLLDYTRKFYDCLLGKNSDTGFESYTVKAEGDSIEENNLQEEEIADNEPLELSQKPLQSDENPEAADRVLPKVNVPKKASEKEINTVQWEFDNENPLPEMPSEKDKDIREGLLHPKSSLSFEMPYPAEPNPRFPARGIEEDDAEDNEEESKETPKPRPKEEKKENSLDFDKILKFQGIAGKNGNGQDIRRKIGINDKYLFLNELFNSEKKNYEAALDQLNEIDKYKEALEWVKQHPATNYNWSEHDETVKSFYDILSKHFSDR